MGKRSIRLAVAISITLASSLAARDAARVDQLLGQMTLDEKITLLGGVDDFYTRPIERLGIPRIKMTDGPNGTRNYGNSTAYPAGVLLAATWDPLLAEREGEQLGRDARARGVHVLLGPGVNIYRHPRNGRNFEYFGEDPLLAGEIGAGYVKGVQSQGVSATVKHYAANNQETDRNASTSEIDERTLREIYLAPFRRIIEKSRPGAMMCSYNRINGTYASANRWLLTTVLRDDWNYDGVMMSDWGAVHGTMGPLLAGLDLEMPWPTHLALEKVKPLVENGVVSETMIDVKVRRLLNWMDRFGWLDKDVADSSIPLDNPEGAGVALEVARSGLTLLKNDDLLPLDRSRIRRVVLVGSNAERTPVGGGGSGYTEPFESVSVLEGLAAALGDRVTVIGGSTLAANLIAMQALPDIDGEAFSAEFFDNPTFAGQPVARTEVKKVEIDLPGGSGQVAVAGMKPGKFSARYRATITPDADNRYTFVTHADDGTRVYVDGKAIIDDWTDHNARTRIGTAMLSANQAHEVVIEYYDAGGDAVLKFGCGVTPPPFDREELQALRNADAVIACVGFGPKTEAEGSDRSYELPAGQNEQVLAALDANPRTLVVLNAGGSCDVSAWIDRVPAMLHAYYAGQDGGTAIAEVLLGEVNPSGRLPFTFERSLTDLPSHGNWGHEGVVEYAEGVFVGYRGFDRREIEPQFPFGFGMSYTRFEVGEVRVSAEDDSIVVHAEIANVGDRDGASVVQCYVEPPATDVPMPKRELRAFQKVSIAKGGQATIELRIPQQDLAYWDTKTSTWTIVPGTYRFCVGQHSRDIAKGATLTIGS